MVLGSYEHHFNVSFRAYSEVSLYLKTFPGTNWNKQNSKIFSIHIHYNSYKQSGWHPVLHTATVWIAARSYNSFACVTCHSHLHDSRAVEEGVEYRVAFQPLSRCLFVLVQLQMSELRCCPLHFRQVKCDKMNIRNVKKSEVWNTGVSRCTHWTSFFTLIQKNCNNVFTKHTENPPSTWNSVIYWNYWQRHAFSHSTNGIIFQDSKISSLELLVQRA